MVFFRVLELITMRGLSKGSAISHFFGTTRRVWGIFFSLYFWAYSFFWYQNIHALSKSPELSGKNHINIVIGWFVAVCCQIEVIYVILEVLYETHRSLPSGHVFNNKVQESYRNFMNEVAFMFQVRGLATKNFCARYYNVLYMFRWAIFSFTAITWFDKPRSLYVFYFVYDFCWVVWTIIAYPGFRKPAGILIIMSEMLIYFRHIAQFAFFIDQFGKASMSQSSINAWTHVSLWSYIIGNALEVLLWFEPCFNNSTEEYIPPVVKETYKVAKPEKSMKAPSI